MFMASRTTALQHSRSTTSTGRLQPRTYVDLVIDVIVGKAAMGRILPGDRINEVDLARELGISRAPIREAFRTLVVQGVVQSIAYHGVRLAPMTAERVQQINEVRFELEKLSLRKLSAAGDNTALLLAFEHIIEDMKAAARKDDRLGLATLDADFHQAIVSASENPVLLTFWQMLKPQLIIMFGLGALTKPLRKIVDEHRRILNAFATHKWKVIEETLSEHILADNTGIDFESIVESGASKTDIPAKPKPARQAR
jgi:DNA-binding GntR family transcriptional regulator